MRALALVALLLVSSLVAPIAGLAGVAEASSPADGTNSLSDSLTAPNETETPTATPTATPTSSNASRPSRPLAGDTARILPVSFEEDFLSVETAERGEVYNTTGPFVIFSVSEPVDQAAISQDKASAEVLEGRRQVRVSYDDDAAPVGGESLYTLTLYFSDGSSRDIELFASQTSVDVGSAQMRQYRPFIMEVLDDAEEAGYERSPEGAESHYQDVQETAQLLDSLFSEYAKRAFATLLAWVMNPVLLGATLLGAAGIALWQLRRNGSTLEILANDSGKASRLRERLWIAYRDQQQTAADEPLRELRGVGEMNEIYWSDAFGVETTAALAELFRQGLPVRRNGEVVHVGGVDGLDAESVHSSWIEAVCRDNRIPSVEIALAHGKEALHRMTSKYGMGHVYEEAYRETCELIDELDESRDVTQFAGQTSRPFADSAGGDD